VAFGYDRAGMTAPASAGRVRTQFLVLVVAAVLVVAIPPVRHTLGHGLALLATGKLGHFQKYLLSLGAWAPAVSIALMTAEALLVPLPVTIIMVANGLVFGLWTGMIVSLVGGLAGGLAAYAIGRWLGRALVERVLPAPSLRVADSLMAKYGAWAVVLGRWIPGVPGDPVSYACGLTRMPAVTFTVLTIIGLIPANLVTSFVGTEVPGDVPITYWIGGWTIVVALWLLYRGRRKKHEERRVSAGGTNASSAAASRPPGWRP
jgi:uncharacterized membrane protein YdjX (TVP38/TMEM64 family)